MRGGGEEAVVFFSINSDLSFPVSPFHTHLPTSTLTGFVPLYHCFPDWENNKKEKMHKKLAKGSWKRANKENWKGQIYILKYLPGFLLKCNLYQITFCLFYYWLTMKIPSLSVDSFAVLSRNKMQGAMKTEAGYADGLQSLILQFRSICAPARLLSFCTMSDAGLCLNRHDIIMPYLNA